MSSALFNAVSQVLSGPNYLEWAQAMESYLKAQGQWKVFTKTKPTTPAEKVEEWEEADLKAQGNLLLRLAPSINTAVTGKSTAKEIWDYLKDTYGKPGVPIVYQDFRAAMALSIPSDTNPIPALDKLEAHFQRLETNKFSVDEHVKGMILMAKLPAAMDNTVQVYLSGLKPSTGKTAIENISLADVRSAVVLQWEQRQGRHSGQRANANKLSAVKRKGPDPSFRQQQRPQGQQFQQQRPQGQQQQQGRPRGRRAGRGRGCGQQQGAQQHAHFAHIADTAPLAITKGPDTTVDPRALLRKPVCEQMGNNKYPSLTRAMDLVEDLGVEATPERIRTLEAVFNTTSKRSSMSSSESSDSSLLQSNHSVSHDSSPHVDAVDSSRSPSPLRNGGVEFRSGREMSTTMYETSGSDSENEPTPIVKRKRTLKERVAPTLLERMDVDEVDAVSLGLTSTLR